MAYIFECKRDNCGSLFVRNQNAALCSAIQYAKLTGVTLGS